jgi:hypothetical protein
VAELLSTVPDDKYEVVRTGVPEGDSVKDETWIEDGVMLISVLPGMDELNVSEVEHDEEEAGGI